MAIGTRWMCSAKEALWPHPSDEPLHAHGSLLSTRFAPCQPAKPVIKDRLTTLCTRPRTEDAHARMVRQHWTMSKLRV